MKDFSGFLPIIIIAIISIISKIMKSNKKNSNISKTTYFDKNGKPINQNKYTQKKKTISSYIETIKQELFNQQEVQKKVYKKKPTYKEPIVTKNFSETRVKKENYKTQSSDLKAYKKEKKINPSSKRLIQTKDDLKKAIIFSEILNAKYIN